MASNAEVGEEGKSGFFSRMRVGLSKTRTRFASGIGRVVLGEKIIDEDLLEEIETTLLTSDVGVEAVSEIMSTLAAKVARKELANGEALYKSLKEELTAILKSAERDLLVDTVKKPFVILMVGVNGAGKTTTVGKLAMMFRQQGKTVMLAAGDTFRAAAVEQLKVWGDRNDIPVISQGNGADSASVLYDAAVAAGSRQIDVLIADTAGRLHSKKNLMEELIKINRVLGRLDVDAPHSVLLVIDAGTGQNAIVQAREFQAAVNVSGLVLTKLDGTAKGGVVFAIAKQLGLPIHFVGVGEQIDDLRPFDAQQFVEALFDIEAP
jgi:fused signal recognition particle receptor|tara:strand:- start:3592 stop:4554 length:963 start_codon:yes stop_codon:yes gene_type:complete